MLSTILISFTSQLLNKKSKNILFKEDRVMLFFNLFFGLPILSPSGQQGKRYKETRFKKQV